MANLTGGCQCGAVRYEWVDKPAYSSVCYCRMCQKASGQPFMGLTGGKREHLDADRPGPVVEIGKREHAFLVCHRRELPVALRRG